MRTNALQSASIPRRIGLLSVAGILGSVLAGAGEYFLLGDHAQVSTMDAVLAAFGVWMLLWPCYALLLLSFHAFTQPIISFDRMRGEGAGASLVLLTVLALCVIGWGVGTGILFAMDRLRNDNLVPVVGTVVGVAIPAAVLVLAWRSQPMVQRILGRLARTPRISVVAIICLLTLTWLMGPALEAMAIHFSYWPLLLFTLGVIVGVVFKHMGPPLSGGKTLVIACLALMCGIFGVLKLENNEALRKKVTDSPGLLPWALHSLETLSDGDGDGFSPYFGGRDCDDSDPDIHPMARDWPANGIDEDCSGADQAKHASATVKKVRHFPRLKKSKKRWNFLIITVDALRPDRLGGYGYERKTSPHMDRLAKNGFLFETAYAPANATRHSVAALFAGRPFSQIDLDRVGLNVRLGPGTRLIFERIQSAGYFTAAHLCHYLAIHFWDGIERGIEVFKADKAIDHRAAWSAPQITDGALSTLDTKRAAADRRPWLMWLHYMEPHAPYDVHVGTPAWGDRPSDVYDGEIRAVDGEIGRLLKALDDRGETQRTVVILTADHGEEFGEHGGRFHGKRLYEESIRVPLIIRVPGLKGRRFIGPVSTMAIPETIANLAGLDPDVDYGTRSLLGLFQGQEEDQRNYPVFVDAIRHEDRQGARSLAYIKGDKKLILNVAKGSTQLFDLERDPGEAKDLTQSQPHLAQEMAVVARARLKNYQEAEFSRLMTRRVSTTFTGKSRPRLLAPGLELLRAELNPAKRRPNRYRLDLWYRAVDERRPSYLFRYTLKDKRGRPLGHRVNRPLLGQYPTHRWQLGQVIHDSQMIAAKRKPASVYLRMKRGAKKVFEGEILGSSPKQEKRSTPSTKPVKP